MSAESRRSIGVNIMIGAGVVGGVAVAHPVGNIIGRTISGAPIPWDLYGWIYLLVAVPAAVAWLIGRAVWARAWRDIPRERAAAAQGAPPQPGTHSLRLPEWNGKDHG